MARLRALALMDQPWRAELRNTSTASAYPDPDFHNPSRNRLTEDLKEISIGKSVLRRL
jgi:hypothetical protein